MIGTTRIGKKSKEELRLKRLSAGIFIAPQAYKVNDAENYFEPSPLFAGGKLTLKKRARSGGNAGQAARKRSAK